MALPDSCDMFVAMPSVTAKGAVIVGKNSDRPGGEVQEVIYQAPSDHPGGAKLQCTYIEIDQVVHTHGVVLSRPAWMWGAEMGANDQGVVIGNEAVWTKEGGPQDLEEKLLGMDLVRLGLERAGTAYEAVQVIGGLLATHGQGGPCYEEPGKQDISYHNSFLIADPTVAYVMDTAGQHWAAERVESGVRNMSNFVTVGTNISDCSPNLKEYAQSKGYWDGSGDFDFAKAFTAPPGTNPGPGTEHPENRFKCGKEMLEGLASKGNFSASSMMDILRNEEGGICRVGRSGSTTMGSMVCVLYPPASGKLCCHWFTATPNPKCSVFKPFVFTTDVVFGSHTTSPAIMEDPAKTKPRFQRQVSRAHTLYKVHEMVKPIPGDDANQTILGTLKSLEAVCISDLDSFIDNSDPRRLPELNELFKDIVESEMKFYHVKKSGRK